MLRGWIWHRVPLTLLRCCLVVSLRRLECVLTGREKCHTNAGCELGAKSWRPCLLACWCEPRAFWSGGAVRLLFLPDEVGKIQVQKPAVAQALEVTCVVCERFWRNAAAGSQKTTCCAS